MLKIAVGYVRCSTDMQEDSIDQQKRAIEAWAKENSFKVIEWFEDEGQSGTDFDNRPAFQRLKRRVESSPNFAFVLVYDESRWGRPSNPRESTYWKMHFAREGVSVRIVHSQSRNDNDIGSVLMEVVEGAEASEYSKKLSRSTLRGSVDNAGRGFSNGGTAPYGYRRVAVDKGSGEILRNLMPGEHCRRQEEKVVWDLGDEEEVKVVRRIFDLKCAGYGYRAVADMLNKESIPCAKRGRWRNRNQKWSTGTIQSIITNPTYQGDRAYNRHPLSKQRLKESNVLGQTKNRWMSDESAWIIQKDAHPAIVSRAVFKKASFKRTLTKRANQHLYESRYLLSGLVKCMKCEFNYQGQSYSKQNIFYYIDGGYMNKGNSVCDRLAIRKERLEGFVLDLIRDSLPFSKPAIRLEEMISAYLGKRSNRNAELETIEKKLWEIEQKIQNLLTLAENGVGMGTMLGRLKELEKSKTKLESEKQKVERIVGEKVEVKSAANQATSFLLNFEKHFEGAPIQEKKEMIRQVVIGIRVDPATRTATCAITRIPMVNRALTTLINPSEFLKSSHHVGARRSGGTNLTAVTTFHAIFQMELE